MCVPFLGQVRHRVPALLLASFVLAALAFQFGLAYFHPRQRWPVPLGGVLACLVAAGQLLDPRLKAGQFLRFGPGREVVQRAEPDLLLLSDHQRRDVGVDRGGQP